jgi:hypothetical protein
MLFPGHERSQRLLGDLANTNGRAVFQNRVAVHKDNQEICPWDRNLVNGFEKGQKSTIASTQKEEQVREVGPAKSEPRSHDQWPHGTPPTGPRGYLQRNGQGHSTGQSSGGERYANASSSVSVPQRPSLSLTHSTGSDSLAKSGKSRRISNPTDARLRSLEGTDCRVDGEAQEIHSSESKAVLTTLESGLKRGLMGHWKEISCKQPKIDFDHGESSASVCLSVVDQTTPEKAPRSSTSQSQSTLAGVCPTKGTSLTTITPKSSRKKTENQDTSSPLGIRHEHIAHAIRQSQRSGGETSSVISASSSTAEMSSPSTSSSSRLSICHTCKKPPFREKLKGCFECSRHYHNRCAKPKER